VKQIEQQVATGTGAGIAKGHGRGWEAVGRTRSLETQSVLRLGCGSEIPLSDGHLLVGNIAR